MNILGVDGDIGNSSASENNISKVDGSGWARFDKGKPAVFLLVMKDVENSVYRNPKGGQEDLFWVKTLLCVPIEVSYISTDLEVVTAKR